MKSYSRKVHYMEYSGSRPTLGLVVGEKCSLMVDAGSSVDHAEEFLECANSIGVKNLKYVAITHHHWDHISGIPYLNLVSIGSCKTQEQAGLDIGFEKKLKLDLGGVKCIVEHIGGDHSDDSSLVYVENEKIMFLGDATYRGFWGERRYHSLENVRRISDRILSYDCELYVTSHKDPYSRAEMEDMLYRMIELGETSEKYGSLEELKLECGLELTTEDEFYLEAFYEGISKKGGERAG